MTSLAVSVVILADLKQLENINNTVTEIWSELSDAKLVLKNIILKQSSMTDMRYDIFSNEGRG